MEEQDIHLRENICAGCGAPLDRANHMPDCISLSSEEHEERKNQAEGESWMPDRVRERDEEGIEHDVVSFHTQDGKDLQVVFYKPEELPFIKKSLEGKQNYIIGDTPQLRKKEVWEMFVEKVRDQSIKQDDPKNLNTPNRAEAVQQEQALFMVEQTPKSILDLAFYLGIDSPELRNIRKAFSENRMTDEAEEFMDKIIAARVIDDEGNFQPEVNTDGEVLMILALQENAEAQKILQQKLDTLKALDTKLEADILAEMGGRAEHIAARQDSERKEKLELKNLVAVHATNFRPSLSEDGMEVKTTFDGTKGRLPVDTVHFALNHHVTSHMYGKWDSQPYVVLSPLEDIMKQNGKPEALNTVDTYFEVSPGRKLVLPKEKSRMVFPEKLPSGKLFEQKANGSISYKKDNFSEEDMKALLDMLSPADREDAVHQLLEKMYTVFNDMMISDYYNKDNPKAAETLKTFFDFKDKIVRNEMSELPVVEILSLFNSHAFKDVVHILLEKIGITDAVPIAKQQEITERFEGFFGSLIKERAVNDTIRDMGFKVERGGMWAWQDDWDVTGKTVLLGDSLGVPVGPHSSSPMAQARDQYLSCMNNFEDGTYTTQEFRKALAFDAKTFLPQMTPETRRMLYMKGLL